MAANTPAIGSGRAYRPDPILHIGPRTQEGSDPVASMPPLRGLSDGEIARIQRARCLNGGAAWRGVGLRLKDRNPDSALFEIFLSAGDGRDVVIAIIDEEDAIAAWRSLSLTTGLPMLMETVDGLITQPFPQIGRVALGQFHHRRQHAFLKGRRLRFQHRRKVSRLTRGQPVLEAEEIARGSVV